MRESSERWLSSRRAGAPEPFRITASPSYRPSRKILGIVIREVAVLRNVGAMIAGLVVGMIVNLALVQLNTVLFPLPDGVDLADRARMRDAIQDLPAAAWILVFVAHLGQSFVGAWVAARLGSSHWMILAMIVGIVSLGSGIANAMLLAAPAWTWLEMPFYLVVAWMAGRAETARRIAMSV